MGSPWRRVGFIAALAVVVSACGAGGPSPVAAPMSSATAQAATSANANAKLAEIIRLASEEKNLVFEISEPGESGLSTSQAERRMMALVKSKFGIDLNVKFDYALGFGAASARALSEIKAGSPPSFDLMYQTTGTGIALYKELAIEPVPWRQTFDWISEKALSYGGRALLVSTGFLFPAYNTRLVRASDAPKSWEDLLDPRWKGRIATTIYQDMWPTMARPENWGEPRTRDFLAGLAKQQPVLGRFPEVLAKLESGEVAVAAVLNHYDVDHAIARGAPVAAVRAEPMIVMERIVFVPQRSRHPNAAMLMAAALLTPEGQQILADGWSASSLFESGTPAAKLAEGRKLALPDVDFERDRSLDLQKEYEQILVKR